jgi:hypothetical protein
VSNNRFSLKVLASQLANIEAVSFHDEEFTNRIEAGISPAVEGYKDYVKEQLFVLFKDYLNKDYKSELVQLEKFNTRSAKVKEAESMIVITDGLKEILALTEINDIKAKVREMYTASRHTSITSLCKEALKIRNYQTHMLAAFKSSAAFEELSVYIINLNMHSLTGSEKQYYLDSLVKLYEDIFLIVGKVKQFITTLKKWASQNSSTSLMNFAEINREKNALKKDRILCEMLTKPLLEAIVSII